MTPEALERLEAELAAALAPISAAALAGHLEELRAFYGEWADLKPALAKRVNAQWLAHFDGYPERLFALACFRYRETPAGRAPTPGELKALVADEFGRARHLGWQAQRARAHFSEAGT
ncbi:MAG: hypothetical protein NW200_03950 [Hyphomonadaceae bacterium]|nr:hypothetical protein [Hyphomonadaceae bacterium]